MTAIAHQPHPVTRTPAGVRDQLTDIAGMPVWSMDATQTTAAIDDVQRAEAQLAAVKAQLLSHANRIELPARTGATSTANWHAHTTRTTRPAAHRAMRLANGLEDHDLTRAALAEGRLHVEQAEAILRALTNLPADLDPELNRKAEAYLLEQAADFDAKGLKHLGRCIFQVIDPDAADSHEAMLLEREERDAAAATRLVIYDDGHGKVHGKFTLDGLTGAMLKKALYAFAAPRHRGSQGPLGERKPTPERLGHAFEEMIQRYPTKKLPRAGGMNATVVVLMPLDTLMGDLRAAHLDTGESISPAPPAAWPARPGSSPRSSAASPRSSTSAEPGDSPANPNESSRPSKPRLRSRRLRLATRHDPPAPPDPLGRRRQDQQRRPHHDLPTAPRPSPRHPLPDDQTTHRPLHLPPTNVSRPLV